MCSWLYWPGLWLCSLSLRAQHLLGMSVPTELPHNLQVLPLNCSRACVSASGSTVQPLPSAAAAPEAVVDATPSISLSSQEAAWTVWLLGEGVLYFRPSPWAQLSRGLLVQSSGGGWGSGAWALGWARAWGGTGTDAGLSAGPRVVILVPGSGPACLRGRGQGQASQAACHPAWPGAVRGVGAEQICRTTELCGLRAALTRKRRLSLTWGRKHSLAFCPSSPFLGTWC